MDETLNEIQSKTEVNPESWTQLKGSLQSLWLTNKSEISKDKASEVRGRLRKDREVLPNKIEKEIINEYNNP